MLSLVRSLFGGCFNRSRLRRRTAVDRSEGHVDRGGAAAGYGIGNKKQNWEEQQRENANYPAEFRKGSKKRHINGAIFFSIDYLPLALTWSRS
jgi:hypothetical protein